MAAPAASKPRELPMAFMPSPNDAYSYPDGVRRKRATSEVERVPAFAHETATVLGSTGQRSDTHTIDDTVCSPSEPSGFVPIRQQVPTASKMPDDESRMPPTDQEYWYHQYTQARSLIHLMHDLWRKDSEGLQQKIATLEEALVNRQEAANGANGTNGTNGTNGVSGKENNDAAYGAPDIVKASQEKLRALSNASYAPPPSNGTPVDKISPQEPSKTTGYFPPQPSTDGQGLLTNTLASIPESDFGLSVDDPLSPPQTAKILTPPHARTYAGHTPRVPIHEASASDLNLNLVRPGQYDGVVEEPALALPRVLPTKPKSPSDFGILNDKLQRVASDPDLAIPQALRAPSGPTSPSGIGSASVLPEDLSTRGEINGVKLRKKQSINFGMPLLQGVKFTPRSPDGDQL